MAGEHVILSKEDIELLNVLTARAGMDGLDVGVSFAKEPENLIFVVYQIVSELSREGVIVIEGSSRKKELLLLAIDLLTASEKFCPETAEDALEMKENLSKYLPESAKSFDYGDKFGEDSDVKRSGKYDSEIESDGEHKSETHSESKRKELFQQAEMHIREQEENRLYDLTLKQAIENSTKDTFGNSDDKINAARTLLDEGRRCMVEAAVDQAFDLYNSALEMLESASKLEDGYINDNYRDKKRWTEIEILKELG